MIQDVVQNLYELSGKATELGLTQLSDNIKRTLICFLLCSDDLTIEEKTWKISSIIVGSEYLHNTRGIYATPKPLCTVTGFSIPMSGGMCTWHIIKKDAPTVDVEQLRISQQCIDTFKVTLFCTRLTSGGKEELKWQSIDPWPGQRTTTASLGTGTVRLMVAYNPDAGACQYWLDDDAGIVQIKT